MEKSSEEKEMGGFGSRSRNLSFRKRSDIFKSTPLSLHGLDSHFPDVLCQVSTGAGCHLEFVRVVAPENGSAAAGLGFFFTKAEFVTGTFFVKKQIL